MYTLLFTDFDDSCQDIIVDSGCPSTLASRKTVNDYIKNNDLKNLKTETCHMNFIFGSSSNRSQQIVTLLIKVEIKNEKEAVFQEDLQGYVVDGNVPFLLGMNTQEDWHALPDPKGEEMTCKNYKNKDGEYMVLQCHKKGKHLRMNLLPLRQDTLEESVLFVENYADEDVLIGKEINQFENMKMIHQKLNHMSKIGLKHAVVNADLNTEKTSSVIDKVVDSCTVCQKFQKSLPRPKTAVPTTTDFNQNCHT